MTGELSVAQQRGLDRLVRQGTLSAEQVAAVRAELAAEPAGKQVGGIWEVLGYAGGALVLGGAALLIGMSWEDLSRTARVGLLAAATVLLLVAGVFIAGGPREPRRLAAAQPTQRSRIVAVLFALASVTAAMTVGSGLDGPDAGDVTLFATLTGTLVAAAAYLVLPSVPGLLAIGGFAYWLVLSVADEFGAGQIPDMVLLIVLGAAWAALSVGGALGRPAGAKAGTVRREVGLGIAAATALSGAQWTIGSEQVWSYAVTFVLAVLCFVAFLRLRSTVLLVFGVLGMTTAVPEAVYDWTGGAVGGPLIVLLVGAVLLAAGGFGLRLRRRVG